MITREDNSSPLASKLFKVDGVNQIFYGEDHITIGKNASSDWDVL